MISPLDLSESFEYTIGTADGVDNTAGGLENADRIKNKGTCFEKLLHSDFVTMLSNTQDKDTEYPCTQVDDSDIGWDKLELKHEYSLAVPCPDNYPNIERNTLQICVAAMFGLGTEGLEENGGVIPPFADENEISDWCDNTAYFFCQIKYDEIPQKLRQNTIKPNSLCLIFGSASSEGSCHGLIGVMDSDFSVRCIYDPLSASTLHPVDMDDPRNIPLKQKYWVGVFKKISKESREEPSCEVACEVALGAPTTNAEECRVQQLHTQGDDDAANEEQDNFCSQQVDEDRDDDAANCEEGSDGGGGVEKDNHVDATQVSPGSENGSNTADSEPVGLPEILITQEHQLHNGPVGAIDSMFEPPSVVQHEGQLRRTTDVVATIVDGNGDPSHVDIADAFERTEQCTLPQPYPSTGGGVERATGGGRAEATSLNLGFSQSQTDGVTAGHFVDEPKNGEAVTDSFAVPSPCDHGIVKGIEDHVESEGFHKIEQPTQQYPIRVENIMSKDQTLPIVSHYAPLQLGFSQSQIPPDGSQMAPSFVQDRDKERAGDIQESFQSGNSYGETTDTAAVVRKNEAQTFPSLPTLNSKPGLQLGFSPTQPMTVPAADGDLTPVKRSDADETSKDNPGNDTEFVFLSALTGQTISAQFSMSLPGHPTSAPTASSHIQDKRLPASQYGSQQHHYGSMLSAVSQFDVLEGDEGRGEAQYGEGLEGRRTAGVGEEQTEIETQGGIQGVALGGDISASHNSRHVGTSAANLSTESFQLPSLSDGSTLSSSMRLKTGGSADQSRCSAVDSDVYVAGAEADGESTGWITSKNATRIDTSNVIVEESSGFKKSRKNIADTGAVLSAPRNRGELVQSGTDQGPAILIDHDGEGDDAGTSQLPSPAVTTIRDGATSVQSKSFELENIASLTARLEALERSLREREATVAEREKQLHMQQAMTSGDLPRAAKGVSFETGSSEVVEEPTTSSCISSGKKQAIVQHDGLLSQGGLLAVDGLLQLCGNEERELDREQITSAGYNRPSDSGRQVLSAEHTDRMQWSSLAKAVTSSPTDPDLLDGNISESPRKKSRLMRKTAGRMASPAAMSPAVSGNKADLGPSLSCDLKNPAKSPFDFECSEEIQESVKEAAIVSLHTATVDNGLAGTVKSTATPTTDKKSRGGLLLVKHSSSKRRIAESDDEGEWNSQADLPSVPPKVTPPTHSLSTGPASSLTKKIDLDVSAGRKSDNQVTALHSHGIPDSLLTLSLNRMRNMRWKDFWKELENTGWHWQRGRDLIDFVYCRPEFRGYIGTGTKKRMPDDAQENVNYFISTDAVIRYVAKHLIDENGNVSSMEEEPVTKRGDPGSGENKTDQGSGVPTSSYCQKTDGGSEGGGGPSGDGSGEDSKGESSEDEERSWLHFVSTMPWPELWRNLQAEGWTWNHGTGLVTTWYLAPGIDKTCKGTVGSTVFGDEEDLRAHILRSLCKDYPQILAGQSNGNLGIDTGVESGEEAQSGRGNGKSKDFSEDWSLSKHRAKRKLRPKSKKTPTTEQKSSASKNIASNYGSGGTSAKKGPSSSLRKKRRIQNDGTASPAKGCGQDDATQQQALYRSTSGKWCEDEDASEFGAILLEKEQEEYGIAVSGCTRDMQASFRTSRKFSDKISAVRGPPPRYGKPTDDQFNDQRHNDKPGTSVSPRFQGYSELECSRGNDSPEKQTPLLVPRTGGQAKRGNYTPSSVASTDRGGVLEATPSSVAVCLSVSLAKLSPHDLKSGRLSGSSGHGGGNRIFRGIKFVLTGLDPSFPLDREKLEGIIQRQGGFIADAADIIAYRHSKKNEHSSIVVIASPTGFRRPNYLLALAAGVVHVHPQWVVDSVAAGLLPPDKYILPSGSSALHPFFVFRKQVPRKGLLSQLRVLSFAGPVWNDILTSAGAILFDNQQADLGKYRSYMRRLDISSSSPQTNDGSRQIFPMPDIIVIDSYAYSEGNLDVGVVDLVGQCAARRNSRAEQLVGLGGIPRVVSSEWVAHCLEMGEILDFDQHSTFAIPDDPTRSPLVLKMKRKSGESRYVVGDIVLYEPSARALGGGDASHACHQRRLRDGGMLGNKPKGGQQSTSACPCLLPGRIVAFCRKNRGEPAQVRMRPLSVNCLLCRSQDDSPSEVHSEFELTPNHFSDFLLASEKLHHHIVVLSSETRGYLDYALSDPTVYFSSVEWEQEMGYSRNTVEEAEPEMMVQHSQDY